MPAFLRRGASALASSSFDWPHRSADSSRSTSSARRLADAVEIVRRLRAEGVSLLGIVSGDRRSVAERIGRELGIDRVYAELTPRDKLEVVRSIRARPELRPVIMVGTA